MNLENFKSELRADIRRLQAALNALEDTGTASEHSPMQPSASHSTSSPSSATDSAKPHRKLSSATRNKISQSMKDNWEHGRRKGRKLSPAVKAKIAKAQKARWAKQKAAAHTVASAPAQAAA